MTIRWQPFSELCCARKGLENSSYADDANLGEKGLSNGMGLFLQKTNIIRDYLEARVSYLPVAPIALLNHDS